MNNNVFGYIYCAVISCYPDYVKVGCTADIFQRMKNLSGQLVDKFECVFFIKVEYSKMFQLENIIHKKIVSAGFPRINNKEFFKCKPHQIKYIFDNYKNYINEMDNNMDNNINNDKKNNKINDKIKSNENILEYVCKCCKYSTDIKCNYLKHNETKSHIENKNKMFNCNDCNKEFFYESGYNNHIDKYHKTESKITDPEIKILLLEQEIKFLKEKSELEIKLLKENKEEVLKSKEELSKYQDEHIEYLQQKNIENYKISQLSSINYATMYYNKPIGMIGIDIENQSIYMNIKQLSKNFEMTEYFVAEKIINLYETNKLIDCICNIICNIYKTNDPIDQTIWSTDISRLVYIIRLTNDGETKWIHDKKGVIIKQLIIEPLLDEIQNILIQYLVESNNSEFINITEKIINELKNKLSIKNQIIKTLAPMFLLKRLANHKEYIPLEVQLVKKKK